MTEYIPHSAGDIALGRQMTVEFYDCDSATLTDAVKLEQIFLDAAADSGAHVVDSVFHSFEPQGVSGVVVISESHFAVHAWPEHGYAAVDLFTCGEGVDFDVAVKSLAAGMGSGYFLVSSLVNRGIIGENGVERLVPVVENAESHGLQLSWQKRFEHTGSRAMSSCVDVYGCRADVADETVLRNFAGELAGVLTERSANEWEWNFSEQDGKVEFRSSFAGGRLNGVVMTGEKNVYLDIFAVGFFDPRKVAEAAMISLAGQYYRMQPQIRQ